MVSSRTGLPLFQKNRTRTSRFWSSLFQLRGFVIRKRAQSTRSISHSLFQRLAALWIVKPMSVSVLLFTAIDWLKHLCNELRSQSTRFISHSLFQRLAALWIVKPMPVSVPLFTVIDWVKPFCNELRSQSTRVISHTLSQRLWPCGL